MSPDTQSPALSHMTGHRLGFNTLDGVESSHKSTTTYLCIAVVTLHAPNGNRKRTHQQEDIHSHLKRACF